MFDFSLNVALDAAALAADFGARGRVEVKDFLGPGQAETLRTHLLGREDWVLAMNAGERVYELPRARLGELSPEQRRGLDARVEAAARHGFHFCYETIRIPDEPGGDSATLLDRFVAFMRSAPVLIFMRTITARAGIAFADGQATAYSPGHFLTRHDDDVPGKRRLAAYVLGLTPAWRAEWGGLLMFHGEDGNVEEAFTPAMGALRLFAVPAQHSVSYVAPFAPEPRLSVTGWLRERG